MRNQSHYHSRKLQSLRKKRSLSGRPPRFQSCCTWPVSIWRPKGREGSMPSLFWPLLCSAHCKLQQWLHLHDVIFKRLALPFSLNHGVHGMGVRKTFLVGRCSSPPSPPTGLFFEVIAGGLLVQLQIILKPVFSRNMYHYWKNKY